MLLTLSIENAESIFVLNQKTKKMKNKNFANRIKELRVRKGLSQEELSEKTGLSLRTIQRIENGETEPRGDSLKRLTASLGVSPDEIIDWHLVEDNNVLCILNLSQIGFIIFPFLGIVIPMAIWILKKDKIIDVDKTGKSILNFQITWTVILFLTFLFFLIYAISPINFIWIREPRMFLIFGLLYLYNIMMITINVIRTYRFKENYYKPAINILR